MKAIRVTDGVPVFGDEPIPTGEGVVVSVAAASICASDLSLLGGGLVEGRILGHEIAGFTPDGRAVAVEPIAGCRVCEWCRSGERGHCVEGPDLIGVGRDGGMAEKVLVGPETLVPLPSGLDPSIASLVEPLAVALHAVNRARVTAEDRVLVVGAGAIGLATVAVLNALGRECDVTARYPHQAAAAERLGGRVGASDGYDVVVDSIGTESALREGIDAGRPGVRIAEVGMFWQPVALDVFACLKEIELIGASMYRGLPPDREIDQAARLLAEDPTIAEVMITHRLPLDAAADGFSVAADRSAGSIKVVFEP